MTKKWREILGWLKLHWRRVLLFGGGGLVVLNILIQVLYPGDRMVPFASVDGISVSAYSKSDVTRLLDETYKRAPLAIYFGEVSEPYRTATLEQLGTTVSNEGRVTGMTYPWYVRLVPTSIFWAHAVVKPVGMPVFNQNEMRLDEYIAQELGNSCSVQSKDATIQVEGEVLKVVPSSPGGTCQLEDVKRTLGSAQPEIGGGQVRIAVQKIEPAVDDADAEQLAKVLTQRIADGVRLTVHGSEQTIPKTTLLGWLDFTVANGELVFSLNEERARSSYLDKEVAPKVAVAAGTTVITTHDFTEISRDTGPSGKALDAAATLEALKAFLGQKADSVAVVVKAVAPALKYNRTFSPTDTGLTALMKSFAESHPGTFGISLVELSGKRRHADYNGGKQFISASTYKLFIAYSTLKRVESGEWQWGMQVQGGRDLAKCFDDMIVKSDNACAEMLLQKIGFRPLTDDAKSLGLTGSTFLDSSGIKTTANDLSLFLSLLQSGQMLGQQASRDRLIDAMKRNQYRQGIPAGANGAVADKVGFLDGLLHDAAIVYSPSGTYALTILTDGSSWATIAELTRELEKLRAQ